MVPAQKSIVDSDERGRLDGKVVDMVDVRRGMNVMIGRRRWML